MSKFIVLFISFFSFVVCATLMSASKAPVNATVVAEKQCTPFLAQYGSSTIILDDYNSKTPCRIVDDAGEEYRNFMNNTNVSHVVIDTMSLKDDIYLVVQADNYNPIISALSTPLPDYKFGTYNGAIISECEPVYGENRYKDFDFNLLTDKKFQSYLMNLSYFQIRIRPTNDIYVQDLIISGKDDFGVAHWFKTQLSE